MRRAPIHGELLDAPDPMEQMQQLMLMQEQKLQASEAEILRISDARQG